MTPLPDVTRVEVINHKTGVSRIPFGRAFVIWDENIKVEFDLQDDNRTLKIFISDRDAT